MAIVDLGSNAVRFLLAKVKPGDRKLSEFKLLKDDPAGVEKMSEEIKTRYAKLFRV